MSKTRRIFNKREYNSNNGMMTSVWGPAAWMFLHTISFNYPVNPSVQDRKNYKKFIESFAKVLPCGKCRENFKHTLQRLPLTEAVLDSRDSLSRYVYKLHNDVNARLQKTKRNPSYCEVRDLYERFRARCGDPPKSNQKRITRRRGRGNNNPSRNKAEIGCSEPLKGIKTKCLIRIVPKTKQSKTFALDPSCNCKTRGSYKRTRRAIIKNKK